MTGTARRSDSKDIPRTGFREPLSWYGLLDNVARSLEWLDLELPGGPWRLFEIADQDFVPPFIREKVQTTLTAQWNYKLPLIQQYAPSYLAATLLEHHLALLESPKPKFNPAIKTKSTKTPKPTTITGMVKRAAASIVNTNPSPPPSSTSAPSPLQPLTVVDFCSGAGGPTPAIEKAVNASRKAQKLPRLQFLLTDIHPPLDAWMDVSEKSEYLSFVPQSVDATNPPPSVISSTSRPSSISSSGSTASSAAATNGKPGARVFRTFFLSFHHFDDEMALRTLKSTLQTSDGFAIVEMQERRLSSLLLMVLEFFLVYVVSFFWFWRDKLHLGFVYFVPVLPAVLAFDGFVSSLRTRTFGEVMGLVDLALEGVEGGGVGGGGAGGGGDGSGDGDPKAEKAQKSDDETSSHSTSSSGSETNKPIREPNQSFSCSSSLAKNQGSGLQIHKKGDWVFEGGRTMHTFPLGYMNWVVGRRQR